MKNFYEALADSEGNAAILREDNFFGMLIGNWCINYVDNVTGVVRKEGWRFSRVLEEMVMQDVIVLPYFEYGITLCMYNPAARTWEIAYGYTEKIIRFEAGKQEDRIVLSNFEDEHRKWMFTKIAENHFRQQDIIAQQDGE